MYKKFTPWDRISAPDSLKALLEEGGANQVEVFAEAVTHELAAPEDWWTMVLGGGLRGTIDQLDSATRERVRQANLQFLRTNEIHALDINVLYALAQK